MDNLERQTMDITAERIEQLKEVFPEVFKDGKIDFEALQNLLGEYVEDAREKYSFTWAGKTDAIRLAQKRSTGTLLPCKEESVNFDTTQNLYIEGDNLEVLKLLSGSYINSVKMIYIDPPYNTGNDFVYKDDYRDSIENYKNVIGEVSKSNAETAGRYNMMLPRLKLARVLLKPDGVIFISCEDSEITNMRKLCDEVFGESNFAGVILWKKKTNGNNMGVIPPVHDYIVAYSKNPLNGGELGFELTEEYFKKTYSNPDNDPRGAWTTTDLSANHKGPYFAVTNPNNGETFYPSEGRYWVFSEAEIQRRIADGRIIFGKTGVSRPVQKVFANERIHAKIRPESWWDNHGMNEDATVEMRELFNLGKIFTHPKPIELIYNLLKTSTDKDSLILDFFSGYATIAHAVMQLNAEDGGKRKYICVQIPELTAEDSEAYKAGYKNLCEIGKERIRRAGKKIKEASPLTTTELDVGFKVFKLDTSNLKKQMEALSAQGAGTLFFADRCFTDTNAMTNCDEILKKNSQDMRLF